jgi:hypothetical protein
MALSNDYIEDIVQRAEKFDFLKYADKGTYIDAKDTVSNYWVAYILENLVEEEQLFINYDGWKSSYDEKIDYTSPRIEPFRMISSGYTGQKNNTKREAWSFHLDDLENLK